MANPYELAEQLRKAADGIEKEHAAKLASEFKCDAEVLRQFEWTLEVAVAVGSILAMWNLSSKPKGEKANKLVDQFEKATPSEIEAFNWRMHNKGCPQFWVMSGPTFLSCSPSELYNILDKFGPLDITNLEEVAPLLQEQRNEYERRYANCNDLLTILGVPHYG